MSDSLGRFLTAKSADPAHLQHAVRFLVAEWGEDRSAEEMRQELLVVAGDGADLDRALAGLERDGATLEAATLDVLQAAWDDDDLRDAAAGAVEDAETKLPVVEAGLIALVVMYGMYLARTGGKRETRRTTIRRADGSYETEETTEYYGPAEPLNAVVSLLTGRASIPETTSSDDSPDELPPA